MSLGNGKNLQGVLETALIWNPWIQSSFETVLVAVETEASFPMSHLLPASRLFTVCHVFLAFNMLTYISR